MINVSMTSQQALYGFGTGVDCSQAVFGEIASQIGLDKETAMKIAANFGGGMWEGETCGAVTGALMALGLKYGQAENADPEKKNTMIAKAMEFKRRFSEIYGSCICKEILGYKIPEDMEKIMQENKFGTVCCNLVADACQICADIINEDE